MKHSLLFAAFGLSLGLTSTGLAQFPGPFGNFNRQNPGTSNTRQYNSSTQVGSATISSDPETGRIIVITDEETSEHIAQVITNLDIPKPQVLIKVVFLEVTYNNGLDRDRRGLQEPDRRRWFQPGLGFRCERLWRVGTDQPDDEPQRPGAADLRVRQHPARRRLLPGDRK